MITFQRSHPLQSFGHLSGPNETRALQTTLKAIQTQTGDPGFNPGEISGVVGKKLVVAAIYGAVKFGPKVPGMDKVFAKIDELLGLIPFVGDIFLALAKSAGGLSLGFDQLPIDAQIAATEWVERNAGTLDSGFKAALAFLVTPAAAPPVPGAPGSTFVAQLAPGALEAFLRRRAIEQGVFPEGSVAIRDPAAGTYRIVKKG